jgi:hypothetical protein
MTNTATSDLLSGAVNTLKEKMRPTLRKSVEKQLQAERTKVPNVKDYSEKYLAERAAFIRMWEQICTEGQEKGFLSWTNEHPGSHLAANEETTYVDGESFAETDEEFQAQVDAEVERRLEEYEQTLRKEASGVKDSAAYLRTLVYRRMQR